MGHFFELEPSKDPTEISLLESSTANLSLEIKVAAITFSPRFSRRQRAYFRSLSNDIRTKQPPSI